MLKNIIKAPRTDAIYNMHSYLTKVPVGAIIPFIEEYTPKGGVVVDMFAGSGMTALAAKMANRNAIVSDISKLGQHIGVSYLTQVPHLSFETLANEIVSQSKQGIGRLYLTERASDNEIVESIRTIWSYVYECSSCNSSINYYSALKDAGWISSQIECPSCKVPFIKKGAKVIDEQPALVVVKEQKQVEQELSAIDFDNLKKAESLDFISKIPSFQINENREMYKRSALAKWNLTNTKDFFSQRNAATLFDLWNRINEVENELLRKKLLFCFTAILPRASKRYQWSIKAPLNAANQNYYIAPVFYEWNIYDLFLRKIRAAIKSDNLLFSNEYAKCNQEYVTASANKLKHLRSNSIDYVFTDPPFGSNIFYSDMNLFQEAWLQSPTDHEYEAVIRTTVSKEEKLESKKRYKGLLKDSFSEAFRVLKSNGHLSIVFGNSKGDIWALAQEAFIEAGFTDKPVAINILDKGQRSVKGLNSGTENVATLDLILTLKKPKSVNKKPVKFSSDIDPVIGKTFREVQRFEDLTVSHLYLEVLKNAIYDQIHVSDVDLKHVLRILYQSGYEVDDDTGVFKKVIQGAE